MAKPTLVLVPGIWEGPMIYSLVAPKLKEHGFAIVDAPFVSTGTESPGNPSMLDDVKGVRSHIEPLVREDKQVVVVAHSAGGFISAAAVKGLSIKERSAEGLKGGVSKFVFLAAGLGPEGFEHKPLPFMDFQVSRATAILHHARHLHLQPLLTRICAGKSHVLQRSYQLALQRHPKHRGREVDGSDKVATGERLGRDGRVRRLEGGAKRVFVRDQRFNHSGASRSSYGRDDRQSTRDLRRRAHVAAHSTRCRDGVYSKGSRKPSLGQYIAGFARNHLTVEII